MLITESTRLPWLLPLCSFILRACLNGPDSALPPYPHFAVSAGQLNNRQKEIKSSGYHSKATTIHLRPYSPSKWRHGSGHGKEIVRMRSFWSLQGFPVLPTHCPSVRGLTCTLPLLLQLPCLLPALLTSPFLGWFSLAYIQQVILSPSINSY